MVEVEDVLHVEDRELSSRMKVIILLPLLFLFDQCLLRNIFIYPEESSDSLRIIFIGVYYIKMFLLLSFFTLLLTCLRSFELLSLYKHLIYMSAFVLNYEVSSNTNLSHWNSLKFWTSSASLLILYTFEKKDKFLLVSLPSLLLSHSFFEFDNKHLTFISFLLFLYVFRYWNSCWNSLSSLSSQILFHQSFIGQFGLYSFLEHEWSRLQIPLLLKIFWLLRLFSQLCFQFSRENEFSLSLISELGKDILVTGCETQIAVLGFTSIISEICHYIGLFFYYILNSNVDNRHDKSVSLLSAILFLVLSFQSGLTSLEPDKRYIRLGNNLTLLLIAILHLIHNMVSTALVSLSNNQNYNRLKHLRALSISFLLILVSWSLLWSLWQPLTIGTWLFGVLTFCIEMIFKVLLSLIVNHLFLYDIFIKDGSLGPIDDIVYRVKTFGTLVEISFSILLLLNGILIFLIESRRCIRGISLLFHAYSNIWTEGREVTKTFIKRRTALGKIKLLEYASREQILEHDDVCPICYMTLCSAKITKCNHYFHENCLIKWLYVEDACPICHRILHQRVEGGEERESSSDELIYDANEIYDDVALSSDEE